MPTFAQQFQNSLIVAIGATLLQVLCASLAGYAFAVIYAIAGLLLGTVADRWHRPRLIAAGLFVWSALTAASGLAQNFWQLMYVATADA